MTDGSLMEWSVQKTEGQKQKPSKAGVGGRWGARRLRGGAQIAASCYERKPGLSPRPGGGGGCSVGKEVLWNSTPPPPCEVAACSQKLAVVWQARMWAAGAGQEGLALTRHPVLHQHRAESRAVRSPSGPPSPCLHPETSPADHRAIYVCGHHEKAIRGSQPATCRAHSASGLWLQFCWPLLKGACCPRALNTVDSQGDSDVDHH